MTIEDVIAELKQSTTGRGLYAFLAPLHATNLDGPRASKGDAAMLAAASRVEGETVIDGMRLS